LSEQQPSEDRRSIVVVDYGVGNLASIANMLRKIGVAAFISSDPSALTTATGIILPGVGAFDHAMRKLRQGELVSPLERRVLDDGVPLLGLCLGAQLLTKSSEEGSEPGLGWIDAVTTRFDSARMKGRFAIPHMGWSDVVSVKAHPLLVSEEAESRFYFAHSYHLSCNDPELTIGMAHYGYEFAAAVASRNLMGVQFHPEKSHVYGMRVLRNFCSLARAPVSAASG
jgi:imidazole glycerol-phosphate synthase subunit HisH